MKHYQCSLSGVCALMTLSCLACEARHVGEQEQLVFVYDSPFDNETFNKPLVVGGRLEVSVEELQEHDDDERAIVISKVTSSDPEVLTISGTVNDMFEIEARRPGKVTLTVEGTDEDGQTVSDRVAWRTDEMASMVMSHTCGDGEVAYMLEQNASFTINLARYNARGERLSGFGHAPVEVTPKPAHLRRPVLSQSSMDIITRGASGDVSVSAKDSEQRLIMKRIGLGDITHIGTEFDPVERMLVGQKIQEMFVPFVGEHPLCEPKWPMTIQSKTPEVCDVTVGDEEGEGREEGVATLEALALGTCTYVVGLQGHDIARTFTVSIGRLVFEDESTAETPRASVEPQGSRHAPSMPWWLSSLLALCVPGVLAPLWWMMMRGRRDRTRRE